MTRVGFGASTPAPCSTTVSTAGAALASMVRCPTKNPMPTLTTTAAAAASQRRRDGGRAALQADGPSDATPPRSASRSTRCSRAAASASASLSTARSTASPSRNASTTSSAASAGGSLCDARSVIQLHSIGVGAAQTVAQCRAQLQARAVQPGTHGIDGQLAGAGDLFVAQAAGLPHQEDVAIDARQPVERLPQRGGKLL